MLDQYHLLGWFLLLCNDRDVICPIMADTKRQVVWRLALYHRLHHGLIMLALVLEDSRDAERSRVVKLLGNLIMRLVAIGVSSYIV